MVATPQLSRDALLARQVTGGELSEEQKKQLAYQRQVRHKNVFSHWLKYTEISVTKPDKK